MTHLFDETSTSGPPLVSVVIPAYRASSSIAGSLGSVFAQTFRDFEVIVINDGSPDTVEFDGAIRSFMGRIDYLVQRNGGPSIARNTGLRRARGRYVAFLDADDQWSPTFLQEQVKYLEENPSCDLVYCDALIWGDTSLAGRRFMEAASSDGPITVESLLLQRCNVILSGVVARIDPIFAAGLFDPALRRGQDFDLWLRMAHHGYRLQYQRRVLVLRFERPDDAVADLERLLSVLDKTARTLPLSAAEARAWRWSHRWATDRLHIECARHALASGDVATAARHLRGVKEKSLKVRLGEIALAVAPRLLLRLHQAWSRPGTDASARPSCSDTRAPAVGERFYLPEPHG